MGSDDGDEGKDKPLLAKVIDVICRKACSMGPSALVAYLLIDIAMYSWALVAARAAVLAATGREPWQDVSYFLLVLGGIWAGNNATRPLRLAGAAALAPAVGKATAWVEGLLPNALRKRAVPGVPGVPLSSVAGAGLLLLGWGAVMLPAAGAV